MNIMAAVLMTRNSLMTNTAMFVSGFAWYRDGASWTILARVSLISQVALTPRGKTEVSVLANMKMTLRLYRGQKQNAVGGQRLFGLGGHTSTVFFFVSYGTSHFH